MIRRLAVTAAALVALAGPARAQCGDCAKEWTQVQGWMTQTANVGRQISQGIQQIQLARSQILAFTNVRDLGSAMSALGMVGIQNPLPVNPWAVQGLISGTGGVSGLGSSLSGLFTGSLAGSQVYTPPGSDFRALQIIQNGNGLAGIQALAMQAYQSAGNRLTELQALQARQAIATDPKDVMDLQLAVNRVQAEGSQQQQQIQTLAILTQVQERQMRLQEQEYARQHIDNLVSYLRQNEN